MSERCERSSIRRDDASNVVSLTVRLRGSRQRGVYTDASLPPGWTAYLNLGTFYPVFQPQPIPHGPKVSVAFWTR